MNIVTKTYNAAKRFCASAFGGTTINAETGVVEQHQGSVARPLLGLGRVLNLLLAVACLALALFAMSGVCSAQTDITSTISTISGYWDAVKVVAIAILLFLVGRRIVRKT
jgi:hypothetical protein